MRYILLISIVFNLYGFSQKQDWNLPIPVNETDTCIVNPTTLNEALIPKNFFGISLQEIRVSRKSGTYVLPHLKHRFYSAGQKLSLLNNFFITPFDERYFLGTKDPFNFYRLQTESIFNFYFHKRIKTRSSSQRIYNKTGQLIRIQFEWPTTIRYGLRLGPAFQQYSLYETYKNVQIIGDDQIETSTSLLGFRQGMMHFGINRQQVKGSDCDFCGMGRFQTMSIREFYVDVIYAPFQYVYGSERDSIAGSVSGTEGENGILSNPVIQLHKLGVRGGFERTGNWTRNPYILLSWGFEIGYYTGPNIYNFEIMLNISAYLYRLRGVLKEFNF
ncbi:MAG: hypothetical protein R2780_09580 [Crocinitomicaceae bacterium]|nr:hypothetical protein [Crocinitomicaceae bacterium]